ncbi:MAG: hypothetical protein ACXVR9_11535 [Gaiellaceae bacterium]
MRVRGRTKLVLGAVLALAVCALTASAGTATGANTAVSSQIPKAGTGSPTTGAFTPWDGSTGNEFAGGGEEEGADAYGGNIVDRSISPGGAIAGVPTTTGKKAKSDPTFNFGFEGLNHYQQRYSRGGNQFSVEPPDQGMCAGNGYVVEAVNDVFNVFSQATGQSLLPDNTSTNIVAGVPRNVNHAIDLNSFYNYPPAINRATGVRGEFVTDPSCIYDAQTQRFFVVVLTLDPQVPGPCQGVFSCVNHLDLAVSQTSNPTGGWNIYKIDVTADGSPGNTGGPCPCLGDYPHIGADANGIYLTTNSYPWGPGDFDGAQIYALSKAQLAAGAPHVTMQHIDTTGMVQATSPTVQTEPGFTVWPAQSPGTGSFNLSGGGTEYALSSNAGEEASGHHFTGQSTNLVVWAMTNTASLNTASPNVSVSTKVLDVNQYGIPPKAKQPGSGSAPDIHVPQGHCLNDESTPTVAGIGCWKLLVGATAHGGGSRQEVVSRPDSNDTRMQQVTYANGKLWGALDTALNPGGGPQRAGIAWYIVKPDAGKLALQGYLGATGHDFTYPAIGVTASGRGIMAFTDMGDATYPSAAYASIDANAGIGTWNVVPGGAGAAADDGFSGYKQQNFPNPIRPRWGDYGAAAVDGNSIWIASEYIAASCDYNPWGGAFFIGQTGDNLLGTCAGGTFSADGTGTPNTPGPRTALANWSTRISKFTP